MSQPIARPLTANVRTLDELIQAFLRYLRGQIKAGENAPDTFGYYESGLRRWRETIVPLDKPIEDLRVFDLMGAGGVSSHRIFRVKHLFKWGADNGLIEGNPFANVIKPAFGRRERVFERHEAARLLRVSDPRPRLHNLAKAAETGACDFCAVDSIELIPVLARSAGTQSAFDVRASWCADCRQRRRGLWKAVHSSQLSNSKRHVANTAIRPLRATLFALGHTGARPGEIRALRWQNYDAIRGEFKLKKFKAKKRRGEKNKMVARVILVDPLLARLLAIWYQRRRPKPGDFIFLNWYGKPWSTGALCKAFNRCRERAGLDVGDEPPVAYTFRHTVGTRAARPDDPAIHGASLPEIAALLGQADLRSTQRYVHLPTGTRKTLGGALARAPRRQPGPQ